ncbi:MAG: DUF1566 domain-containing protein [Myxococcaceae bacterium]|nr:DUF1566 domain-containing protein [Myxococcaceae bacterium]MBH2005794.1 DUF1566 domain-containing protein [Myxococcaceae bacterium]
MWNASTGVYQDTASESVRFNSANGVVVDSYTGLQWQAMGSAGTYFWDASAGAGSAQAYCMSQTTGNYDDWRLPTSEELMTLVDYTIASSPMIDTAVFSNTQFFYWTSTVYEAKPGFALSW